MVVSRKQIFNLRCIFVDFSLFLLYLLAAVLIPTHFYIERYHWCPHKLLHCHISISVSHSDLAVLTYNFGQNIYRLFHVSGKFLFTTNEKGYSLFLQGSWLPSSTRWWLIILGHQALIANEKRYISNGEIVNI